MQATRLSLGVVNLFGMYIIPPLIFTAGTHFTYPQREGGLNQPPATLSQESVGIEPGTSCMKVEYCRQNTIHSQTSLDYCWYVSPEDDICHQSQMKVYLVPLTQQQIMPVQSSFELLLK